MEQFNSKLYDKYKNLKKRKLSEDDEWTHKQDSVAKSFELGVEDLIEDLRNENDRLRSEIASLQEKYAKSQQLVLEESRKTKELSNEVGRLQNLLLQRSDNDNAQSPGYPTTSPKVNCRNTNKDSSKKKTPNSLAIVQYKEVTAIPYAGHQNEIHVPVCCRNSIASSGEDQLPCAFRTLMEFLVRLKLSLKLDAQGLCLWAFHQKSGYTFTLTWIRHEGGGEGELMYRVSSLGTLERIAHDWMKEDIVFSMTMCPVFFQRISQILGQS